MNNTFTDKYIGQVHVLRDFWHHEPILSSCAPENETTTTTVNASLTAVAEPAANSRNAGAQFRNYRSLRPIERADARTYVKRTHRQHCDEMIDERKQTARKKAFSEWRTCQH